MSQKITCPNCNFNIDLNELAEKKYSTLIDEQNKKIKLEQEKQRKIFEEELNKKEQEKNKELEEKTNEMRKKAQEFANKKAEEERKKVELEMQDMNERLKKAENEKQESKKRELEFIKKQREIEEKEKNFELELEKKMLKREEEIEKKIEQKLKENSQKKISDELEKIQEEARKKELEYQKQNEQMKKTIDDLKRKSEQQSMQIQGDSQEDDIKNILIENFKFDKIEDIKTGQRGADLLQNVFINENLCGSILWESKNTKEWKNDWIKKLKQDQIEQKSDIAIIVTKVMPKGIKNFTIMENIWVIDYNLIIPIANSLRFYLIESYKMNIAQENKDVKMQMLYQYLSGVQFKNRIESIVIAFNSMKENLEKEKRAMLKLWARRDKEIDSVMINTTGLYGDLQGIVGPSLQTIDSLELDTGEKDSLGI